LIWLFIGLSHSVAPDIFAAPSLICAAGIVVSGERFRVVGSGAVSVVDGSGVTDSNIADEKTNRALSIFDVRLHVLSNGDEFDLRERRPFAPQREKRGTQVCPTPGL
jgi:cyanophycinase-like exopeptidase